MSNKVKFRMQLLATIFMLASSVFMVLEELKWYEIGDGTLFSLVFYYALLVGSILLTIYYKLGKFKMLQAAHITFLVGFSFRFCDLAFQCLFGGDAPPISIFLFDFLPGLALVSEVAILVILMKKAKSGRFRKIILANCLIQSIFWGLVLVFGVINVFSYMDMYTLTESIGGLYGVMLFITYLNIGLDFMKEESAL